MSRDLGTESEAAVLLPHLNYVALVSFDFASGAIYLNTSDRDYVHDGHTYRAAMGVGGISEVSESADLAPDRIDFVLPGVASQYIATTLTEKYHGRSTALTIAYLDDDLDILPTPFILWEGEMDKMSIKANEGVADVLLSCENRLIHWNRSSGWLYTQEHQNILLGGGTDNFLDQVAVSFQKALKWMDTALSLTNFFYRYRS